MTTGGWLMLICTWGAVILVTLFCILRLLGKR